MNKIICFVAFLAKMIFWGQMHIALCISKSFFLLLTSISTDSLITNQTAFYQQ